MSKIKVLQLGSPSGLYGAERWILALINNLNPSRVESLVGAIKDVKGLSKMPLCAVAEEAGFETYTIESYGRFNFSAPSLLREVLLKEKIDILHTHGYKTDMLGFFAVKGTSCKIITTPHGWTNRPDVKLFCYEFLDRFFFAFFDAVVPLSEQLKTSLNCIPGLGDRLKLITNGVDIKEIEAVDVVAGEMAAWREQGVLILGYIGRLVPGKGLDVLLNSMVHFDVPHWKLAIVGDGEYAGELKELVRELNLGERVQFFGFCSDRLSFLKGFDIFILPSRSEGLPRCIMEAMAAGVAVVASDIPGCRQLVRQGETGLLFEMDNAEELALCLKLLDTSVSLREKLGKAGNDLIYYQYSAAKMAEEYECLYASLCSGSSS